MPEEFVRIEEETQDGMPNIPRLFASFAASPRPNFYCDEDGKLRSPQEAFFGLYAFRNIIRGPLIAARAFEAGSLLKDRGFFASSVFSFYCCAYHLLSTVLALNGRVWIEEPLGMPVVKGRTLRPGSIDAPCVVARLTKSNNWLLEKRQRTHAKRWDEIRQASLEDHTIISEEFLTFFSSITRYGPYEIEDEQELIAAGLERAAGVRHESIYAGFGFDDYAYDEASEGISDAFAGVDLRARAFASFGLYLLRFSLAGFQDLKAQIPSPILQKTRALLAWSVNSPPFEDSDFALVGDEELAVSLRGLQAWLLGMESA